MICNLCPRHCNAERTETAGNGFCKMGTLPPVARAAAHYWEEPCISGTKGSGTIFFSGCNLGCVFCQNEPISHHESGQRMDAKQLSQLMRRVEELGVHNINLVTPTHFAPILYEALSMRKPSVPVVWNSGGYESPEMIRAGVDLVDVWLPDFKYMNRETAAELAAAPDYPDVAMEAIRTMREISGPPVYDNEGIILRGTLIRHLILPLRTSESIEILRWVAKELPETPISLMRQYTPMRHVTAKGLERRLTAREYIRVRDEMLRLNLPGWFQGKDAADKAYTPAFMDEESQRLFKSE